MTTSIWKTSELRPACFCHSVKVTATAVTLAVAVAVAVTGATLRAKGGGMRDGA